MFRLKILKQLNGRKREEVRELENACRIHDHIEGGVLLAGDEGREGKPIFFLCYHNDFLAGFAMMHQIGDGAAEVCSYVHPEYRRNSLLKRLLKAARKEALNNEITTMNAYIGKLKAGKSTKISTSATFDSTNVYDFTITKK